MTLQLPPHPFQSSPPLSANFHTHCRFFPSPGLCCLCDCSSGGKWERGPGVVRSPAPSLALDLSPSLGNKHPPSVHPVYHSSVCIPSVNGLSLCRMAPVHLLSLCSLPSLLPIPSFFSAV
eukprot:RCo044121